jgi:hypothetical protein
MVYFPTILFMISALAALPARAATGSILWQTCTEFNSTVPLLCGNLSVPLDYTQTDTNATMNLQLLKVPAVAKPSSNRSIIFNFGGPGDEDRLTMADAAAQMLLYVYLAYAKF